MAAMRFYRDARGALSDRLQRAAPVKQPSHLRGGVSTAPVNFLRLKVMDTAAGSHTLTDQTGKPISVEGADDNDADAAWNQPSWAWTKNNEDVARMCRASRRNLLAASSVKES